MSAAVESLALLSLGTASFVTLFKVVAFCIENKVPNKAKRYEISLRVVSVASALSAVFIGLLTMVNTREDIIYKRYLNLDRFIWFWLPYFYYDTWAMYQTYVADEKHLVGKKTLMSRIVAFLKSEPLMMVHHVVLPPTYGAALLFFRNGKGDYLIGMAFLMETTIPFISTRQILLTLGMKDTLAYIINGIMLAISFGLARVVLWFAMIKAYAMYRDVTFYDALFLLPKRSAKD